MTTERPWQRGETVIVRDPLETRGTRTYEELTGDHEPNVPGWPYIVLEDTEEVVALYLPEGTKLWRWNILDQRLREPRPTTGDSVRLLFPGKAYAVDAFFETGAGPAPHVRYFFLGAHPPAYPAPAIPAAQNAAASTTPGHLYGWKVDLITPFRRTALGFDVSDEVLDIVVRPDRSYVWKDEDQMERLVELGIYAEPQVRELRAAGDEVVGLIQDARPPYDDEWTSWRPPPELAFIPEAPEGWQYLPIADSEWGALHRRMNPGSYR
jgi:hypothetical protein